MNLTLSIDDKLLERAREAARAQGKSVNQLVRDYLQQLAGSSNVEAEIAELRSLSGLGDRKGWKFNREEIHDRTKLR